MSSLATLRRIPLCIGALILALSAAAPLGAVSYDVVYVRWPRAGDSTLIYLPQGEDPYRTGAGADLMLLRPDGSQRTLVDCTTCCVQDPAISFDGEWVYYTKLLDADDATSPSYLFKMHIAGSGADFREVQLTFDDGYTGYLHQGNDADADDLARYFGIRDMGPAPLPGGRIAFTSNRQAEIAFRQGTAFSVTDAYESSVMQIYVMDDHAGERRTAELANLRQVGRGNLHMALHPVVLQDGRLLFSNWDDAGGKFHYAMTTLYTMNPDGSNLMALTEPHDHHKNVDHFATQLGDGTIVTAQYYPSFNFGFGHLCRFAIATPEPAYTKTSAPALNTYNGYPISFRSFDRKGWESVTPHTSPEDCPAPNFSGKYCMPAAAPEGDLLVSYSTGGVNYNRSCGSAGDYALAAGIYLIPDAATRQVTDPKSTTQLVKLHVSSSYNAIWPRPVVSYDEIHGIAQPKTIAPTSSVAPSDNRLKPGEPYAIVGTSSLYNRESATLGGDPFRPYDGREVHTGGWVLQGTDAGVVKNSDIYGIRIVIAVPKPFRSPIDRFGSTSAEYSAVQHLLPDGRADRFVEGYGSVHGERWKILAEFPVRKTDSSGNPILDPFGAPDTSFAAKIPANTPFFFQGIDKNGMTLFSEMTWRAPVPGEVRTDCGGCHAHSIPKLAFSGTAAARRVPIQAKGIDPSDPMISSGLWDVTSKTPLVASDSAGTPIVKISSTYALDVEYFRDVRPILTARCVSCHNTAANKSGTDLAFDGTTTTNNAYARLVKDPDGRFGGSPPGGPYVYPQLSKYVRANQARQSLLVWKLFGARLDGRTNAERGDDLDFTPHSVAHGATLEENRTIARWIDLGCPIDFQDSVHAGYRYTDDNGLPVVNIAAPAAGSIATFDGMLQLGLTDAESGVDWSTLEVSFDSDLSNGFNPVSLSLTGLARGAGSAAASLPLPGPLAKDRDMIVVVSALDRAGNANVETRRFRISSTALPPPPPPPPPPADPATVIVDNDDSGTSRTGTWSVSGGAGSYGTNSLYAKAAGATYTWTATLAPGSYAVYAWWTSYSSRTTSAEYTVVHASGSAKSIVDQTRNGGQWNLLGTYTFGATGTVRLTASASPASTSADAVRFVPSGGTTNAPPTARIVSITPNPATAGSSVSFSGAGSDSDGTVTAYEWRSDLAGVLSTAPSFSTSSLAAGTHTISFRVRDDKSAWSSAVQQSLAVNLQSPQGTRIVIDNGAAPTSFTGTWSVSTAPNAYGASSVFAKGSGKATYQFTLPAAGSYKVDAWWTSTSGRSPAVPIDIAHATGTSRVTVNQRSGGGAWNALGTFNFGTRATVTINVVDGYSTCADAISFTPTSQLPPPAGTAVIIDNGAPGTSSTGTWSASTAPSPYGASSVYAKNGPTYTYTAPVSGTYRVYAWWTEWSSRGTAVPYTITHSSGSQTVKVNQQTGGGRWNLLGTFNFSGKATIKITAAGTESTCADAVKLEPSS